MRDNQIYNNRQAGIAVENGANFEVLDNDIQNNAHGILLWTRSYEFLRGVPNLNATSRNWLIERNKLLRNRKAIRIAANQDHGVRLLDSETSSILPSQHHIQNNDIQENVIGIELENVQDTQMSGNQLNNLMTDVDEKTSPAS